MSFVIGQCDHAQLKSLYLQCQVKNVNVLVLAVVDSRGLQ